MMLHTTPLFSIYFGNAQDNLVASDYLNNTAPSLRDTAPFDNLFQRMHCDELVFLRQTHSTQGFVITKPFPSFIQEGDFLITSQRKLALGVMTADCLPLVLIDNSLPLIAIAHVGWRGAVAGIIPQLIQAMHHNGADTKKIEAFFGPCAHACCYEVTNEFRSQLEPYPEGDNFLVSAHKKLFFDLPQFCVAQLTKHGVSRKAIHLDYCQCTIHNIHFCSNRRDSAGVRPRQMSVAMLG